ncbi:hypothetical protein [Streptomyces sp. TE33382]
MRLTDDELNRSGRSAEAATERPVALDDSLVSAVHRPPVDVDQLRQPAAADRPVHASSLSQGVLPRTCGSRTPVTFGMHRAIHGAAPGSVGTTRVSMVCELAEHTCTSPHWGVVLEFTNGSGAVWARWSDANTPEFAERGDCPTGDAPAAAERCVLFDKHPGPCSPDINPRYRPDPARLPRARTALRTLGNPDVQDRPTLQAASNTAALSIWDELTSFGRWTSMAECDQAALYRHIANAGTWLSSKPEDVTEMANALTCLAGLCESPPGSLLAGATEAVGLDTRLWKLPAAWQASVLGDQHQRRTRTPSWDGTSPDEPSPRPPFHAALAEAEEQAARGEHPPQVEADWPTWSLRRTDLEALTERGTETRKRLSRLPYGWRVDAVRRIQDGTNALSAASPAGDINVLRSYGLWLGSWNGGGPRRPRRNP